MPIDDNVHCLSNSFSLFESRNALPTHSKHMPDAQAGRLRDHTHPIISSSSSVHESANAAPPSARQTSSAATAV